MRKRRWYLPVLLCLMILLTACGGGEEDKGALLRLTFLDTGKSDCIVIEAGESVVVNDAADADDGGAICAFLDERGIERIEYLILSHFDKDHIGSAAELITRYEVGQVMMPDYEEDSEPYLALLQALRETETTYVRLRGNAAFSLEGIDFYVDAPKKPSYDNDNNYSLITTVINGDNRFLLMGDAQKKRTEEFLDSPAAGERYDLVKMPHHGDYNKKLEELFTTARPRYAVLTPDAARERVEEETVALLEASGCEAYYTDEGAVSVTSDGKQVRVSQESSESSEISGSIAME